MTSTDIAHRKCLTFVWLFLFVASLIIIALYLIRHDKQGVLLLLPEQYGDAVKPLAEVYGLIVGAILAAWFLRPLRARHSDVADPIRFRIALICTLLFNLLILAIIAIPHVDMESNIQTFIGSAQSIAKYCGFLVAGVNAYYFGARVAQ